MEATLNSTIFDILEGPDEPVITEDHLDAQDIQGGFEGGRLLKVDGVYHMFPTERAGIPGAGPERDRINTRIGHWTSEDAVNWTRVSTLYQSSGNYTHIDTDHPASDRRAAIWSFLPVFNQAEDRWNGFYVAYTCQPDISPVHSFGRIWRSVSQAPGMSGVGGPYEDAGIVMEPGLETQAWEGRQGVDSFFPYRVGQTWFALYGGAFPFEGDDRIHGTSGKWYVGLARADDLAGPWLRLGEDVNPVTSIHPWFVENPLVTQLPDGTYIAMFDGGPEWLKLPNMFGYSLSVDGVNWSEAMYFPIRTRVKQWWHTMRTPLGLVPEGDNVYTIVYNAINERRFHPAGMVRVRLKPDVLKRQRELIGAE
ncbi:MAG: hypothetical protein HN341_04020 [Verrucomicrobia bacterium]|jgi:hypothetical protein|nr:hypothetical protein [Verrucomicrobiota bacterium]